MLLNIIGKINGSMSLTSPNKEGVCSGILFVVDYTDYVSYQLEIPGKYQINFYNINGIYTLPHRRIESNGINQLIGLFDTYSKTKSSIILGTSRNNRWISDGTGWVQLKS